MGEGESPVGNRDADRLVAKIEPRQRPATSEPCRQLLNRDDSQRFSLVFFGGARPSGCAADTIPFDLGVIGVLSFDLTKIEECIS